MAHWIRPPLLCDIHVLKISDKRKPHFYERVKPQKGIYYFVSGAGGKLRSGDIKDNSSLTDKGYDRDMSFMLFEVVNGKQMHFQVISRTGETVDSGILVNQKK